jgi:acyl-CoA synthetase (AMP-forming)/AMP-acid ligase II
MNIGHTLTQSARTFPDHPAIVYGGQVSSYACFNRRANRLANALHRLGVSRGDHVAILMYNRPEMLEALYACFKMGCAAVPINFRLHPKEFAFIIDHSQAGAVIVSPELIEPLTGIRELIPRARHLVTSAGASGELLDYESLLAGETDRWEDAAVDPDDSAWLFYTSGTTGAPKGAMLTHRNLLAMIMGYYADICPGFGSQDVILHAAPLSHGSGLWALPNIAKAAKNVILEATSFNAEEVLALIQEHQVTNMFCVAAMVKRMMECPHIDQYDHGSLKSVCYGGGPMMVTDVFKAIETFGPVLINLYGQGESLMTISALPRGDHLLDGSEQMLKRLESVGIPLTDVEVRIFDPEDREVPVGEIGEIVTRSDLVMKGYWRNPEATAETLRNGWLHTGDVGRMDENGYVFLMDRSKDMIVSGGENIYPREVEEMSKLPTEKVTEGLSLAGLPYESDVGFTFPGVFGAIATAYFDRYGATREHLMNVTIKSHENARLNPNAQYHVSIRDMMNAKIEKAGKQGRPLPTWSDEKEFLRDPAANPMVAWPMHLFDCSPISDGASCMLLVAEEIAGKFTDTPIHVAGIGQGSGRGLHACDDLTSFEATRYAAKVAYEMAGLEPDDVQFAEVHDCFPSRSFSTLRTSAFLAPVRDSKRWKTG